MLRKTYSRFSHTLVLFLLVTLGCGDKEEITPKNNISFAIDAVTNFGADFAELNVGVTAPAGTELKEKGVCYGTSSSPTISSTVIKSTPDLLPFRTRLTGLVPNTKYHVRSYYIDKESKTHYSNEVNFTTTNGVSVTTNAATAIAATTATSGGVVTLTSSSLVVQARGVCIGTSPAPTIAGTKTSNGTTSGSFTSAITGLTAKTTYFVRAYATVAGVTTYGNEITFTTTEAPSVNVATTAVTSITFTTATSGGTLTLPNGNLSISARGVCWSTTTSPTIANSKTTNGSGTGTFTSSLTNLTAGTTYYVRAYATTANGTVYGNEVTFTTTKAPTLVGRWKYPNGTDEYEGTETQISFAIIGPSTVLDSWKNALDKKFISIGGAWVRNAVRTGPTTWNCEVLFRESNSTGVIGVKWQSVARIVMKADGSEMTISAYPPSGGFGGLFEQHATLVRK